MSIHAFSQGLSDREAIADCIYRAVQAFDLADRALLDSCFFDDAVFQVVGDTIVGRQAIYEQSFDFVSKLDTTHHPSGIRIEFSTNGAKVCCCFLAYHWRQGEGMKEGASRFTVGGYYFVDVEKDTADGLWKARRFKVKALWTEGDAGVMSRG
ncbi:hypothetical protein KC331_g10437 [Hortaea werneckii]|uniref:SnoaL-like domain-containing protein n=1 Tax=Hortaea werneckii TaxID=91943 RepID=A0A3M7CP47_HORWE|nr:hypothetical protein KC331_g10437 [Hortaea werneckii]KAI7714499.1 hypothetical protein KC353_g6772 [Hortaea werneckii]RMY53620.1 hypothetical protein D0865_05155 [Hortaea werneckii]